MCRGFDGPHDLWRNSENGERLVIPREHCAYCPRRPHVNETSANPGGDPVKDNAPKWRCEGNRVRVYPERLYVPPPGWPKRREPYDVLPPPPKPPRVTGG